MTNSNLIGSDAAEAYDVILFGDMFYDDDFALDVTSWMAKLRRKSKTILIGDPGRLPFAMHPFRKRLQLFAKYELTERLKAENHGLSQGMVWGCNYHSIISI